MNPVVQWQYICWLPSATGHRGSSIFSHNRELEARGKPRKLAGKVKGGGARCAERGACEEPGEDCDADDDNDDADCGHMATMPQATAKLFPRNQLGGEWLVKCEVSCDWRFQPLPIRC